jgi:hypothetical protein
MNTNGNLVLTWPTNAGAVVIEEADSLTSPIIWRPISTNSQGNAFQISAPQAGNKFYRARLLTGSSAPTPRPNNFSVSSSRNENGRLVLAWTTSLPTVVEETASLTPPIVWTAIATNMSNMTLEIPAHLENRYFRVRLHE